MTGNTPKVAAFCFVSLFGASQQPSHQNTFPYLSQGWAYSTPTAIGAPMAAPKQSVIPLRLVHFALSFF